MSRLKKEDTFNAENFLMHVARQRRTENTTVFFPSVMILELRSVFQKNVGKTYNENINFGTVRFPVSKFVNFVDYDDDIFWIQINTRQNNDKNPVYLAMMFLKQKNAFLVVQGSKGRLLSLQFLELFLNYMFYDTHVESGAEYAYYIKLKKYNRSNSSDEEEQNQLRLHNIIKNQITSGYEQISLFQTDERKISNDISFEKPQFSEDVYHDFEIDRNLIEYYSVTLETMYRTLAAIVPKEAVQFTELPIEQAIVCEMICAAICHQMNWDFLRERIYKKTLLQPKWIEAINLSTIQTKEMENLLEGYAKTERIRAEERAGLLRILGTTYVSSPSGFREIFFNEGGSPLDSFDILQQLSLCSVFSSDPVEKKMQLFLQKISIYKGFEAVGNRCRPTIDYHIIRSFLRRGFLVPKTKYAREIVTTDAIRSEQTVGAIRRHCADIIVLLSEVTAESIATVNNIEWWLGRSVCVENNPLCNLGKPDTEWLLQSFSNCPFHPICGKSELHKEKTQQYSAPNYKGNSY